MIKKSLRAYITVPTLMAKGIAEGIADELSKEGIDGKQSPT